jgi:purine-binding chemotaxis protein CheW
LTFAAGNVHEYEHLSRFGGGTCSFDELPCGALPAGCGGSAGNHFVHDRRYVVATAIHALSPLARRSAQAGETIQLVSFRLGEEKYGVEITKIQEIILMGEITRIPQAPPFIKGLINLRSHVIPVLDLRLRFGLPETAITDETRIMVVNVTGKTIGLIVDGVSEVLRVALEEITPPPPTVAGLGREYLTGIVRLSDQLLIVLDVEKLFHDDEAELADQAPGNDV